MACRKPSTTVPAAAFVLLAASGCGSGASAGAPSGDAGDASIQTVVDAGGSDDDAAPEGASEAGVNEDAAGVATTYFVATVELQGACSGSSCLCLPQSLPVDASGQAICDVFFVLADGDTCAAHALADASPDVAAAVAGPAADDAQPASVCVLPQLPAADWVNGSCDASTEAGWCYLTGAAAGTCQQVVRASPSGVVPAGAYAVLGCGETDGGAGQDTDASSVGTPCTPSLEYSASFGGFDLHDVTLDEGNPSCPGAVCLVDHFQGRTTCPYGQDSQANPANGASSACTVPGSGAPVRPDAVVGGESVQAWCFDRKASDVVECSCRCADPDGGTSDGATYCACPSGYTCAQVVAPVTSGDPRAGGYCIKAGTAYDPSNVCHATCNVATSPCQ
jgi:hypothetical protein